MPFFDSFMAAGGWALFSLIATFFIAIFFLINQYIKMPGHLLIFWMRVFVVLFMSPLIAHLQWPTDPVFYIAVFFTAVFGNFGDIRSFNASATYGGGVVSRVQPMVVWGSFFLWFLFDPSLLAHYAERPLNTLGVLAALGGCVFFSMRLNKCEVTRGALLYMLPALLCYTLSTVLNKYSLMHGSLEGAVFGYMYFQSAVAVFLGGGYALWHIRKNGASTTYVRPDLKLLWVAALITTFAWICHMVYKNYAMVFTPNPSYVAAIQLTAPLFIALYYRMTGHREEADAKSGYGIMACAMLLVLFTVR